MKSFSLNLIALCSLYAALWVPGGFCFAGDFPAVAEKPAPKRVLSAEEIAQRVKDLGAEKFAVREAATKELHETGLTAIAPLTQAAKSGDLEVTLRAIRILERLLTNGSLEEFEAAEIALENVRESGAKSASDRAEIALSLMAEVREKRAIAAITKLNGAVKPDPRQFLLARNGVLLGDEIITTVVLNKSWKGGEAGLKHLDNLRFLSTVYLVEGVLPAETIADLNTSLKSKFPNFQLQIRGGGRLGVSGANMEGGCQIGLIEPGSAADKAGLIEGDLIVAFNGKRGENEGEVMNFNRLVELLKEHDAGEKVPLLIRRDGREQTIHAVLDEWK